LRALFLAKLKGGMVVSVLAGVVIHAECDGTGIIRFHSSTSLILDMVDLCWSLADQATQF